MCKASSCSTSSLAFGIVTLGGGAEEGSDFAVFIVTGFLKYLFIYLTTLDLSCSLWDLHCVIQDLSLRCMDSLVVALGLSTCSTWA